MGLDYILVICVAASFCFAPLAVYLFWLAFITRRSRPTVMSGTWDFVALAAGLSGFILFGGGIVLTLLQSNTRYWMRGQFEGLRAAWGNEQVLWSILASIYLLLVAGWVVLSLLARRRSLVVYNVDPNAFETTITEVFDQLGRSVERRGNLWIGAEPLFLLDRFQAGHTVTLQWLSNDLLLFQEVERLLREALRPLAPEDNPFSRWLMTVAVAASFAAATCFGLVVYAFSLIH